MFVYHMLCLRLLVKLDIKLQENVETIVIIKLKENIFVSDFPPFYLLT